MQSASTNIGGVLSAMVYQIEQDNIKAKNKLPLAAHLASVSEEKSSMHGNSINK